MAPTRKGAIASKHFPKEHPEKPWTARKRYKKWVRKLTNKAPRRTKQEDLCVGKGNICKGDLGIPRKYMPQFASKAEVRSFIAFVRKAYHIRSQKGTRKANQLRPSQGEISRKRIKDLIKDDILKKINVPLIISKDNYIVDGHHRWAAYRVKRPDKPLPVMTIGAPIKDVLGIAVAWGAKHEQF